LCANAERRPEEDEEEDVRRLWGASADELRGALQEQFDKGDFEDRFQDLLRLLLVHDDWGLAVKDSGGQTPLTAGDVSYFRLVKVNMPWSCWLAMRLEATLELARTTSSYALVALCLIATGYVVYRIIRWRQERALRLRQEVFELVEQVLALLAAQSAQARAQGSGNSWVAVSHIRDQLIPPADRRAKRASWDLAARYVREQESRVSE